MYSLLGRICRRPTPDLPVCLVEMKIEMPSIHLISPERETEKVFVVVYTSHHANNNIKYLRDL